MNKSYFWAFLIVIIISGCTPPKYQTVEENLGTFSYGMKYESVQNELNSRGVPVFKAIQGNDNYLLLQAEFKIVSKSYIFAFKNFALIAIMNDDIFHEAWVRTVEKSASRGNYPFKNGLGDLYEAIAIHKDEIILDKLLNISLKEHGKIIQKSIAKQTIENTSMAISLATLSPLIIGMAPVALIMYPIEKKREDNLKSVLERFNEIKLGDDKKDIKKLFPKMHFQEDYLTYEVHQFNYSRYLGFRNGKVEWISSYHGELQRRADSRYKCNSD